MFVDSGRMIQGILFLLMFAFEISTAAGRATKTAQAFAYARSVAERIQGG